LESSIVLTIGEGNGEFTQAREILPATVGGAQKSWEQVHEGNGIKTISPVGKGGWLPFLIGPYLKEKKSGGKPPFPT